MTIEASERTDRYTDWRFDVLKKLSEDTFQSHLYNLNMVGTYNFPKYYFCGVRNLGESNGEAFIDVDNGNAAYLILGNVDEYYKLEFQGKHIVYDSQAKMVLVTELYPFGTAADFGV